MTWARGAPEWIRAKAETCWEKWAGEPGTGWRAEAGRGLKRAEGGGANKWGGGGAGSGSGLGAAGSGFGGSRQLHREPLGENFFGQLVRGRVFTVQPGSDQLPVALDLGPDHR